MLQFTEIQRLQLITIYYLWNRKSHYCKVPHAFWRCCAPIWSSGFHGLSHSFTLHTPLKQTPDVPQGREEDTDILIIKHCLQFCFMINKSYHTYLFKNIFWNATYELRIILVHLPPYCVVMVLEQGSFKLIGEASIAFQI